MSEEQEVFKFAVTAGLKPGDVVRARTPAGIRVEVTIPPDALPGDIVQFVLPSAAGGSDVGGAGGTTLEEKVDGPTLMAKIKSEEKINVRDVNQAGVSNAAPKITFSITVPLDTKAGQTLVAELPDGQRVVVTVPGSAKPGRDLFFRVPAGGPDGPQPDRGASVATANSLAALVNANGGGQDSCMHRPLQGSLYASGRFCGGCRRAGAAAHRY